MNGIKSPFQWLKGIVVQAIGRERANSIAAPYHDWRAYRRTTQFVMNLPKSDLYINLGCGFRPMAGWVNVDGARGPQVDVVWDLRKALPFPAESCSAIFCEHVIEHLSEGDAERLLKDCYRVLQPAGVARFSTPDAERYLQSYAGDHQFLYHPEFTETIETPLDRINIMMREYGQHLWAYDARSLAHLLNRAGFSNVVKQQFGQSLHPQMAGVDSKERAFESLYVEAVK
jgi:predicted SAM-dependent methyltransferase